MTFDKLMAMFKKGVLFLTFLMPNSRFSVGILQQHSIVNFALLKREKKLNKCYGWFWIKVSRSIWLETPPPSTHTHRVSQKASTACKEHGIIKNHCDGEWTARTDADLDVVEFPVTSWRFSLRSDRIRVSLCRACGQHIENELVTDLQCRFALTLSA